VTRSIDFVTVLGVSGQAAVRDLWAHQDLGSMTSYQVALGPHASVLLLVRPTGPAHFQADVGAWAGSARFENAFAGHEGMGYVTGLDTLGSSVAVALAAPHAGIHRLACRVANATGSTSTLTVRALNPDTGRVHGTAQLRVPNGTAWTAWRTEPVTLDMASGTNLVVYSVDAPDQGGVNLDYVSLA
jgi:alpha-glucosidase